MRRLPHTDGALLVRTDFSDESAWGKVCAAARTPDPDTQAALDMMHDMMSTLAGEATGQASDRPETSLRVVDDRQYTGATAEQLLKLIGARSKCTVLLVADGQTMSHPEHPILVVSVKRMQGSTFRALPSQIFVIESNLAVANLDWEDLAAQVDGDGVLRGFQR